MKDESSPRNKSKKYTSSIFTPPNLIDMFRIQRDNDNLKQLISKTEKNNEVIKIKYDKDLLEKSIQIE